jgi:phosphatidylglycerol:prolipoprotein diacylglycerol transferase
MTVYPFVIHFGALTITGYGIMMMVAFLAAGWIFARRLGEQGTDPGIAWDSVVAAVLGGLAGAKIYYAVLMADWGSLLSRGGLVWYGGFAGGSLAVLALLWWRRQPVLAMGDAMAPALAAGYVLGRIGCFLVGDDYGRPTGLPWGMAFPQGSPPTTAGTLQALFGIPVPDGVTPEMVLAVHPTQLYEAALAFVLFLVLWRLRATRPGSGWLLGLWFLWSGLARLLVEFFRAKDDRFFGPFTLAQAISLLVAGIGAALLARAARATTRPA